MNPIYNRENNNNYYSPPTSNAFVNSTINNFGASTRTVNKDSIYNTIGGAHTEYVNNKEMFNNRIFERNNQMFQSSSTQNIFPSYFNENYNDNRKEIKQFESRIFDLIPNNQKNITMGVVDFREGVQNNQHPNNYKELNQSNIQGFQTDSYFGGNYSDYFQNQPNNYNHNNNYKN